MVVDMQIRILEYELRLYADCKKMLKKGLSQFHYQKCTYNDIFSKPVDYLVVQTSHTTNRSLQLHYKVDTSSWQFLKCSCTGMLYKQAPVCWWYTNVIARHLARLFWPCVGQGGLTRLQEPEQMLQDINSTCVQTVDTNLTTCTGVDTHFNGLYIVILTTCTINVHGFYNQRLYQSYN